MTVKKFLFTTTVLLASLTPSSAKPLRKYLNIDFINGSTVVATGQHATTIDYVSMSFKYAYKGRRFARPSLISITLFQESDKPYWGKVTTAGLLFKGRAYRVKPKYRVQPTPPPKPGNRGSRLPQIESLQLDIPVSVAQEIVMNKGAVIRTKPDSSSLYLTLWASTLDPLRDLLNSIADKPQLAAPRLPAVPSEKALKASVAAAIG